MTDSRFPQPVPFAELSGGSTKPFGMPMCQNRLAVPIWSFAMERVPPARVIEIGSYNGAFATAIGLHARMVGAAVYTYDLNPPDEQISPVGRGDRLSNSLRTWGTTTLDRFPNRGGNYGPGNCRWATPHEQAVNRSSTRFNEDQIQEIRGRREHGEMPASIAKRFGTSRKYISEIISGNVWKESRCA